MPCAYLDGFVDSNSFPRCVLLRKVSFLFSRRRMIHVTCLRSIECEFSQSMICNLCWNTERKGMALLRRTMAVIQLQLSFILWSPPSKSLAAMFISDSATAILAEAAGSISAIVGFSPCHDSRVSGSIRSGVHPVNAHRILSNRTLVKKYEPLPSPRQILFRV